MKSILGVLALAAFAIALLATTDAKAQGAGVWLVPPQSQPGSAPPAQAPPPPPPLGAPGPAAPSEPPPCKPDCRSPKREPSISDLLDPTSVMSVRGSALRVRDADVPADTNGVGFHISGDQFVTLSYLTFKSRALVAIGGGSGGFEGGIGLGLAMGLLLPVGEGHGPLFRLGVEGMALGNDSLFASYLEIPSPQVGYQYTEHSSGTVLELGMRSGVVLTGRFHAGDEARRAVSGIDYGPYAAIHLPFGALDVSTMRVGFDDPVDSARGRLCGFAGHFALCVDGSAYRGNVSWGDPRQTQEANALYGGIQIGVR